jgi:AraC-like DNA-binding protein
MSRSAFVDRFTKLVGMPPIRYLTIWRLQTAKPSLRETRKTIAQLAQSVGYGSIEAFSRAFKREFGCHPHGGETSSQWIDAASGDDGRGRSDLPIGASFTDESSTAARRTERIKRAASRKSKRTSLRTMSLTWITTETESTDRAFR